MSISLPEVFSVMSVHNFNEKKNKFEETESLTAQSKTDQQEEQFLRLQNKQKTGNTQLAVPLVFILIQPHLSLKEKCHVKSSYENIQFLKFQLVFILFMPFFSRENCKQGYRHIRRGHMIASGFIPWIGTNRRSLGFKIKLFFISSSIINPR